MKNLFRLATFVVLVGGWTLAAASLHVIRTPGHVVVMPKDRITFHDTYVDARNWTLADVQMHPAVVQRMMQRGRADLLAGAVDPTKGLVDVQLAAAIEHAQPAAPANGTGAAMMAQVKSKLTAATQAAKSVID